MPSIPLTPEEERQVLSAIGRQSVDDLFTTVPPKLRENSDFRLELGYGYDVNGRGLTEHELRQYFAQLAAKNAENATMRHFLGGGYYDNIIPAIVNQLVLRGEFLTCYTPYQPEISQGTLTAIFEFQTMICRMTGMPVANASMYDGPTATAEAVLMGQRLAPNKKSTLIAASTPSDTKKVVETFLRFHSAAPVEIRWNEEGSVDLGHLAELVKTHDPASVVIPSPNYFGIIEPLDKIRAILPSECLLIVTMADPSALSIFESPGVLGADVVVGEAHQFGTPMLFGGPHVGFFATKKQYLRQMPGRLCGETVDSRGQRAYTLTLSTREQHIRREKATSNICTNQGLIALRTTIYLSFLGKQGFQRLGELNYSCFDYLAQELEAVGIPLKFRHGTHYREGVFEIPNLARRFHNALQQGIVPGIELMKRLGPPNNSTRLEDFTNCLLICVHPKHSKADLDALVEVLSHD